MLLTEGARHPNAWPDDDVAANSERFERTFLEWGTTRNKWKHDGRYYQRKTAKPGPCHKFYGILAGYVTYLDTGSLTLDQTIAISYNWEVLCHMLGPQRGGVPQNLNNMHNDHYGTRNERPCFHY